MNLKIIIKLIKKECEDFLFVFLYIICLSFDEQHPRLEVRVLYFLLLSTLVETGGTKGGMYCFKCVCELLCPPAILWYPYPIMSLFYAGEMCRSPPPPPPLLRDFFRDRCIYSAPPVKKSFPGP